MTDETDAGYERDSHPVFGDAPAPATQAPARAERPATTRAPGSRRGQRRGRRTSSGCLPVLLVLAIVIGLGAFAWNRLDVGNPIDKLNGALNDEAEDYPGPGSGSVAFEVVEGDTATAIGVKLKDQDVVASVEAFTAAANADAASAGIQPGFYSLKKQMSASDVVDVLVDPANIDASAITIPEGLRVVDIVDILAEQTDFRRGAFEKVLDSPGPLGLPPYADGDAEGYLFPATYTFGPDATPTKILTAMVDRWRQASVDNDLVAGAKELGYTPHEVMTIASLVEAEGRGDDMPKVARVIYNRLSPDNTETAGLLQIDATVNYALGRNLGVAISSDDLDVDSPYNTRRYPGLPPGPIEAPGDSAIQAALNPAEGDWLYYVTVNLRTGETKFADTLEEFNRYKAEFTEYCTTSDAC